MISFIAPFMFLLLPLPWLIKRYTKPHSLQYHAGLITPFSSTLTSLHQENTSQRRSARYWIAIAAWSLLILAASGPEWLGAPVNLSRSGRDILLAIDISASMQTADMEFHNTATDRFSIVQNVADLFISHRGGDRLGLILFGTQAYLQAPLTFDLETVREMLQDTTVGLAGTQTAIGDAIGMAIKHFKNYPNQERVLILLTDGDNNAGMADPLEAAKIAAQYGIRIHTVGFGANQSLMHSLMGQQMASVELNEDVLKDIAKVTKGLYFRATDLDDLRYVYERLEKIEPRVTEKEKFRPKVPLYHWPLAISLGLVMLLCFSRKPFVRG